MSLLPAHSWDLFNQLTRIISEDCKFDRSVTMVIIKSTSISNDFFDRSNQITVI